jgi:four helix bundle protein
MTALAKKANSHRDLIVWQRGLELVDRTYALTDQFPDRERYGITAQMRAAALSVPANIAEGEGRRSPREFIRFLTIANGSLRELDTYCEVGLRRKYATADELAPLFGLIDEIGRMLFRLRSALARLPSRNRPLTTDH